MNWRFGDDGDLRHILFLAVVFWGSIGATFLLWP